MKKIKKTVGIAMSGGIDSSITSYLLKRAGYNVIGIFLKFWSANYLNNQKENLCCSVESSEDARRVANKLKFPLYILNFEQIFKEKIVDEFILQYLKGKTPNPCVRCNQYIKFGKLLQVAKSFGADYLATGHYAKIIKNKSGRYQLVRPKDKEKDQTYFLYRLNQNILKDLIFPLSNLTKTQVKTMAKKIKLPIYQKKESQEVCFIPDKSYGGFLKNQLKLKKGRIISQQGEILGKHQGLALYTIGQRKGIEVKTPGPYYVIGKNIKTNELIVSNNPNDPQLYSNQLKAVNLNWLSINPLKKPTKILAQIRYHHQPAKAITCPKKNYILVKFFKPQKAIAPGQSVVFYQKDVLIGGGIIK